MPRKRKVAESATQEALETDAPVLEIPQAAAEPLEILPSAFQAGFVLELLDCQDHLVAAPVQILGHDVMCQGKTALVLPAMTFDVVDGGGDGVVLRAVTNCGQELARAQLVFPARAGLTVHFSPQSVRLGC